MNVRITPTEILEALTRQLGLRLSNNLLVLSWRGLCSLTRPLIAARSSLINALERIEIVNLEILLRLRGTVLIGSLLHYQLSLLLGQLRAHL